MDILLDENIPTKLRFDFGAEHRVSTIRGLGWTGKKNGELLKIMVKSGFQVFITMDQNLEYQQNLSDFPISIFLLIANNNKHQTLQQLVPRIIKQLRKFKPNQLVIIS